MEERLVLLAILAIHFASVKPHPNPYHILGVSRTDSVAQFKSAFRSLAKKWHPDKIESSEVFNKIREAFDVLTDADKRNYYDRIGKYPPSRQSHIAVDIQDYAIQKYAALGAIHLYHHDPDRFSPTTLLTDETYSSLVEDNVVRFGTVWIVKLYASHCNGCSSISAMWDSLVNEYQGWVSFGRINYDLSAGLVRALDLRTIPEVFAVTRSQKGDGVTLTPLLKGDFRRLNKRNFSQVLSSLPCPNDITVIQNEKDFKEFTSENKFAVKIVFSSLTHRSIPVSLISFMFRPDLPKNVKYAFVGNNVARSNATDQLVSVWRNGNEEVIPILSDWERVLSVDLGSWAIPLLKHYTVPTFSKLTYDSFYDICYSNDTVCVVIAAENESTAEQYFGDLWRTGLEEKVSVNPRIRIGWVHASQQSQFVDQLGMKASLKLHKIGICAIKPRFQIFQLFSGSGSNPRDFNQVHAWINAVTELLSSDNVTPDRIPFLHPEPGEGSIFSLKLNRFFEWCWYIFSALLYGTLAFGAIFLLFIGPSL